MSKQQKQQQRQQQQQQQQQQKKQKNNNNKTTIRTRTIMDLTVASMTATDKIWKQFNVYLQITLM